MVCVSTTHHPIDCATPPPAITPPGATTPVAATPPNITTHRCYLPPLAMTADSAKGHNGAPRNAAHRHHGRHKPFGPLGPLPYSFAEQPNSLRWVLPVSAHSPTASRSNPGTLQTPLSPTRLALSLLPKVCCGTTTGQGRGVKAPTRRSPFWAKLRVYPKPRFCGKPSVVRQYPGFATVPLGCGNMCPVRRCARLLGRRLALLLTPPLPAVRASPSRPQSPWALLHSTLLTTPTAQY